MPAQTIHLVQGDTKPDLVVTLANANGPQDLTGATVQMRLKSSIATDPILTANMTVDVPATAGQVRYVWQPSDTAVPKVYTAEFVVTFAGGGVETFPVLDNTVPMIEIRKKRTV